MRRLAGVAILGIGLMAKLLFSTSVSGSHGGEIEAVRHALVQNVAHSGLKSAESVDAWIREEFFYGRFLVSWSADEIAGGAEAGKVRVTANLTSNSIRKAEESIVLRFDLDPRSEAVAFAGMALEGDELVAPGGEPYSLDGAVRAMWDRRAKEYSDESLNVD